METNGTGQEYEVLIRCTHNDKKFAARVSLIPTWTILTDYS
jgi:hypothetical protein